MASTLSPTVRFALIIRPTCPVKVSFMGYDCLSAPSPSKLIEPTRERLSRLRVLWADPTPWQLSALPTCRFGSTYLALSQVPPGSPKFLMLLSRTYSCATSHALRGPRQTFRALTILALFVLASGTLTPWPSAFEAYAPYALYRGCIKL
jgi:hypothetical protein